MVALFSRKMTERSEAKTAKSRLKNNNSTYFDAKLRFAVLPSLRSAIFSENKAINLMVTLPAGLSFAKA